MQQLINQAQTALKQLQTARSAWTDKNDLVQLEAWGKAARAAQATVLSILEQTKTLASSEVEVIARQLSIVTVEAGLGSEEDYREAVEEFERLVTEAYVGET